MVGDNIFFEQEFNEIGEGLQGALESDAIGSDSVLDEGGYFAFEVYAESAEAKECKDNGEDFSEQEGVMDEYSGGNHKGITVDLRVGVIGVQRVGIGGLKR